MSDRFTTVPLSACYADENVRKVAPDKQQDKALRASIEAHGLLENLVAKEDGERFAVCAGGRRLTILQALLEEGKIEADYPVPLRVLNGDVAIQATEASLAENTIRAAIHVADMVEAVWKIRQEGMSIREVARRFGLSERRVRQLTRLGSLAPEVLEASRAEKVDEKEMQAFGATNDQEAQRKVLADVLERRKGDRYHYSEADYIRRALTSQWVSFEDRLGRFIRNKEIVKNGIGLYEKAGGRIEADLFVSERRFRDPDILFQVCKDILIEQLPPQEGVEVGRLHVGERVEPHPRDGKGAPHPYQRKPEELARFDDLEKRMDAMEDDSTEEYQALQKEQDELEELFGTDEPLSPEQKAECGVMIGISFGGDLEYREGLIRPEDMEAQPAGAGDDDEGGEEVSGVSSETRPDPEKQAKDEGLGATLMRRMIRERGMIVQRAVASSPAAAFDILAFTLARKAAASGDSIFWKNPPLKLSTDSTDCPPEFKPSLFEGLPMGFMADDLENAERFRLFCELSKSDRSKILAAAVATQVRAQLVYEGGSAELELLIECLRIPFHKRYRPDSEYFDALRKPQLIEIALAILGTNGGGTEHDQKARSKMKKGELVALLTDVFANPKQGEVLQRVNAWTPPGFVAPEPEPEAAEGEGDEATY